jgi:UDP-N-acetylmuramyl pentapeptide phosphotransferase/UDP-N-acetylglucosamine-1-phosphate transferase
MTLDEARKRKGRIAGLAAIAFGLISAILIYFVERRSPNFIRERHAMELAVLYAVLWGIVGLIAFLWYNRMSPDEADASGGTPPTIATKEETWKRRKGTLTGLAVIALGLASAIVMYLVDSGNPFDYFKMTNAMELAIVHAVLWGLFGLGLVLWHNRQPPDPANTNAYDPNDPYR